MSGQQLPRLTVYTNKQQIKKSNLGLCKDVANWISRSIWYSLNNENSCNIRLNITQLTALQTIVVLTLTNTNAESKENFGNTESFLHTELHGKGGLQLMRFLTQIGESKAPINVPSA